MSPSLRRASVVSALCAPVFTAAAFIPQTTTARPHDATGPVVSSYQAPERLAPPPLCQGAVYNTPEVVRDIDALLAGIKANLKRKTLYDPTLIEDYIGESDSPKHRWLMKRFMGIFNLKYEPGTEQGRAYLQQSMHNVITAIHAYSAHYQTLQVILAPKYAQPLKKEIGGAISALNQWVDTVTKLAAYRQINPCQPQR